MTTEEIVTQELPEVPVTETAETPETAAPETTTEPTTDATTEAPAYTPNYGFKVLDQEHEFIEELRPAITTPELEAKVRELHEKAYGLDSVKSKYERIRTERDQLNGVAQKYGDIDAGLKELNHYVQNGDYDSYFDALKIPKEAIFGWVQKKIQETELPDDQRYQLEEARKTSQKAYDLERQNQYYEQAFQDQRVQTRTFELDTVLTRPQISQFAQEYDARAGTPGAFREQVVLKGQNEYYSSGRDLSAEEAAKSVMDYMGKFIQPSQAAQAPGAQAVAPTPKPIIPNIGGRSASPVKKIPKSLDDLRAIEASMK